MASGGSGFLGSALASELARDGVEIIRIRRADFASPPDIAWDPATGVLPLESLEGMDAVINLAGEPIAHRWTDARKRAILESRVQSTALLGRALGALRAPPRVLLSGSAIGFYGDRGEEELDESSAPGPDFLARATIAWEEATKPARAAGIRVVLLRTGIVLGAGGGALQKLLPPFRLGLGGRLGGGRQWMSWIGLADWVAAVRFLLRLGGMEGAVNLVAPNPVPNLVFVRTLARVLGRPALIRVPAWAIELGFGEMGNATLLASQRVHPRQLTKTGFEFGCPTLEQTLRAELAAGR
jgi:uncharacterized protein